MTKIFKELLELYTSPANFSLVDDSAGEVQRIRLYGDGVEVRRSSSLLEFRIGEQMLVVIPMSDVALNRCRDIQKRFQLAEHDIFTTYSIRRAVISQRVGGAENLNPYIVEQMLPLGDTLSNVVARADRETIAQIYSGVAKLKSLMSRLNLGFERLAPDGIIVGDDMSLYPFRLVEFGMGEITKSNDAVYETLSQWIESESGVECSESAEFVADDSYAIIPKIVFDNHLWCGYPHEERIAVLDSTGYGFVDRDNNVVVESKYLEVDSFREGRAVVKTESGFGVIDVYGRYVMEPRYESLGYNPDTGIIYAREDALWGYFNYCGEAITGFRYDHLDEAWHGEDL